jgi:hypothetical protein
MNTRILTLRKQDPAEKLEQRRKELLTERDQCDANIAALRMRRSDAVIDGRFEQADQLDADLTAQLSRRARIDDGLARIQERVNEQRAERARQERAKHQGTLRAQHARGQERAKRWREICREAGAIAREMMALVDDIRGQVAPFAGLGDMRELEMVPAALVTEFGLAICPADKPLEMRPFRDLLRLPPTYGAAEEFQARMTVRHLLEDSLRTLTNDVPAASPPPEPEAA